MACGYAPESTYTAPVYAQAPGYGRLFIRADRINGIGERLESHGIDCSYILVTSYLRLITGSMEDVLAKVEKALPYCSETRAIEWDQSKEVLDEIIDSMNAETEAKMAAPDGSD